MDDIPVLTFTGDTRPARDALGQRFVEYAAQASWDGAAGLIDRLEAASLALQDSKAGRAAVRCLFVAFRAEWVTRQ